MVLLATFSPLVLMEIFVLRLSTMLATAPPPQQLQFLQQFSPSGFGCLLSALFASCRVPATPPTSTPSNPPAGGLEISSDEHHQHRCQVAATRIADFGPSDVTMGWRIQRNLFDPISCGCDPSSRRSTAWAWARSAERGSKSGASPDDPCRHSDWFL